MDQKFEELCERNRLLEELAEQKDTIIDNLAKDTDTFKTDQSSWESIIKDLTNENRIFKEKLDELMETVRVREKELKNIIQDNEEISQNFQEANEKVNELEYDKNELIKEADRLQ